MHTERCLCPQLRYWVYGNTIESAIDVDLEMETSGYISGLERNKMYEMRALGYSAGGFGKQSPTTLFTLGKSSWIGKKLRNKISHN